MENIRDTSCGKTSPARSAATAARTSAPYSKKSAGSKTIKLMSLSLAGGSTRRQPKLTGTFVQRDYDGNWQISADTSDPDFTGVDAWFNAVYEAAKTTDTNGEE